MEKASLTTSIYYSLFLDCGCRVANCLKLCYLDFPIMINYTLNYEPKQMCSPLSYFMTECKKKLRQHLTSTLCLQMYMYIHVIHLCIKALHLQANTHVYTHTTCINMWQEKEEGDEEKEEEEVVPRILLLSYFFSSPTKLCP